MKKTLVLAAVVVVRMLASLAGDPLHASQQSAQGEQRPTYRSGVEAVLVDVNVVDQAGKPVTGLAAADFEVSVDRKPRRVVSVSFIDYAGRAAAAQPRANARDADPRDAADDDAEPARSARSVLIVVDEDSLEPGEGRQMALAAERFVERFAPEDRLGVVTIPRLRSGVDLTRDRAQTRRELQAVITGIQPHPASEFQIGLSEALEMDRRDTETIEKVLYRECVVKKSPYPRSTCERYVTIEARSIVLQARTRAERTLDAVRDLARGLSQVDGPKTVVLVSGGITNPESSYTLSAAEQALAGAQVTLYTMYLERMQLGQVKNRISPTPVQDDRVEGDGIENLTAAAGGTLLRVVGTVDQYFDRVAAEISASYLLGVQVDAGDRDGRPHVVDVKVKRPDVVVRARKQYVIETAEKAGSRRAAAGADDWFESGAGGRVSAAHGATATSPDLEPLLARAGEQVAAFDARVSAIEAEEQCEQTLWTWQPRPEGGAGRGSWIVEKRRALGADYFFVKPFPDQGWRAIRDVFAVDGRPVRPRESRLRRAFLEAPADFVESAREIAAESLPHELGLVERAGALPTLAFVVVRPQHRAGFVFVKEAEEDIEGTPVWRLAFAARDAGQPASRPGTLPIEGALWVDPKQGRIVRSLARVDLDGVAGEIAATWQPGPSPQDPWMPSDLRERYTQTFIRLECLTRFWDARAVARDPSR